MGVIEIEEMEFFAFHGHYEAEQLVGNRFIVYLRLETDCDQAAQSDELEDALNYLKVYGLVKEQMEIPSKLLEHLCKRILDTLYQNFDGMISSALIKVSKCNPPMGGNIGKVSVAMKR